MIYTLKNTLFILGLLSTLVVLQSCESEGCTDPNGENYDPEADVDDGNCTYARTKFIGSYGVGESCGGGPVNSYLVTIEESATATNALRITNEEKGVTVTGIVSGNTVSIDDTFTDNGQTVSMEGDGTYSNNGKEKIDVEYTLRVMVNGQEVSQSCTAVWSKS